ncbi:MAG: UDP-N-acetylglucosamine--LPS N-acetylglucosamine transferase [Bacteroidota bacterium]
MSIKKKKLLAVSSSGGHWIQLLRLRPTFIDCEVVYASTSKGNATEVDGFEFHHIVNATRKSPWNFFIMFFQLLRVVGRVKPDIIITTGSAPGLMTLAVGKLFNTRNVWIDSIANVQEMSTSGKKARLFADLYLTQWEDLAKPDGPLYKGSIL